LEQIGYQIVHAIAGRMRIKARWLETDPEAAGKLQRLIESLSFITSVRLNPLAQSIVLTYKASAISLEAAQAQLISVIEQVNPMPPPIEVEPPISETTPTTSEPTTSEPAATAVIPSPWDEPVLESADDRAGMRLHSTASLAKRLNTTSQAITQRRTKPNFDSWTQVQDPDGIAWDYDETSQSFCSVTSSDQGTEPQTNKTDHLTEASGEIVGETLSETAGEIVEDLGAIKEPSANIEPSEEAALSSPRKQRKSTKQSEKGQSTRKPRTKT
jgi:Heavy metal associated domain 2